MSSPLVFFPSSGFLSPQDFLYHCFCLYPYKKNSSTGEYSLALDNHSLSLPPKKKMLSGPPISLIKRSLHVAKKLEKKKPTQNVPKRSPTTRGQNSLLKSNGRLPSKLPRSQKNPKEPKLEKKKKNKHTKPNEPPIIKLGSEITP